MYPTLEDSRTRNHDQNRRKLNKLAMILKNNEENLGIVGKKQKPKNEEIPILIEKRTEINLN